MQKTISITKWFLSVFFFLTIAVAVVLYFWWFRVAPLLPSEYNTDAYITGVILLVIYGLTAIFWKYAKNTYLKGFLLVLSVIWLLANTAYIGWFKPFLVDTITCNGSTYFITSHQDYWFYSWDYDQVTKWRGTSYERIFWGNPFYSPSKMICDQKENEIKAFSGTYLRFSDRTDIFDSKPVTQFDQGFETTLGDLSYRLYSYDSSENADGVRKYLLTICDPDKPETCKFIPIDHSSPATQDETGNLIADLGTNEIYILFDEKIYFAYGNETRKFDLLASKKLSDVKHYSIAGYRKDNAYVYVLYECDLSPDHSNRECYYIPFSYTTPEQKDVNLTFDDGDGLIQRLNVYIGSELIFYSQVRYQVSYDENKCRQGCPESQCLVADCSIPGQ